jgi:hypothetical protein
MKIPSFREMLLDVCVLWVPIVGLLYAMYQWFWLPADLVLWLAMSQYPVEESWFYLYQWMFLGLGTLYGWLAGCYLIIGIHASVTDWIIPKGDPYTDMSIIG